MMKRKFSFASILVLLTCMFTLTGCHGSKGLEAFTIPEEFDTSKNYELTFWAKNDTNLTQVAIYNQAIEDFEKMYPNIKVNIRLYTDYSRIYNDVITNISTQTTPNICITYPDHIATYLTGTNIVVPLDELFTDEKYGLAGSEVRFDGPALDEVVPEFLNECKLGARYYAVPYMRSTEALYINKTLVEKLGYTLPERITWDFIWEVSEKAMAKDKDDNFIINGQKVMIPFIYKSTDNMMIQYLNQCGAPYSDTDGNIEIFNDTTKDFLFEIAGHAKTGSFSTFKISSYPGNFLNAGQCIFAVDSTAGATWMGSKAPNLDIAADKLVDFEMVVTEIPQVDVNNPSMISQGPSICIFNKKDNNEVLASWLFTQYLIANKVQIAYSETEGYVPVTTKAQNDPDYINYLNSEDINSVDFYAPKIEAAKLLIRNTENTFTTPVFNGSASLRDAAGQMIENVTKSVNRKDTVNDAYIEKMYSDIQSLYHLNQVQKASTDSTGKADLGPLPSTAKILLITILIIWLCIGFVFFKDKFKKMNSKM